MLDAGLRYGVAETKLIWFSLSKIPYVPLDWPSFSRILASPVSESSLVLPPLLSFDFGGLSFSSLSISFVTTVVRSKVAFFKLYITLPIVLAISGIFPGPHIIRATTRMSMISPAPISRKPITASSLLTTSKAKPRGDLAVVGKRTPA